MRTRGRLCDEATLLFRTRAKHCAGHEVRGLGCFFAVELVKDPFTREALVPFNAAGDAAKPMVEVVNACKSRGLWPFAHFNRLHMAPPLIVSVVPSATPMYETLPMVAAPIATVPLLDRKLSPALTPARKSQLLRDSTKALLESPRMSKIPPEMMTFPFTVVV